MKCSLLSLIQWKCHVVKIYFIAKSANSWTFYVLKMHRFTTIDMISLTQITEYCLPFVLRAVPLTKGTGREVLKNFWTLITAYFN